MAITTQQNPQTANHWLHMCTYPEYYTVTSDRYAESKFKYKFTTSIKSGQIGSPSKNPPYPVNGLGVYNPNNILKDYVSHSFQPEIVTFVKATGGINSYQVNVAEFGVTASPALASQDYIKAAVINGSKEDWNVFNYIMDSSSKSFLTDWSSTRKVTLNDRGTLDALSGGFNLFYLFNSTSYIYQLRLILTNPVTGLKGYYHSKVFNPYYGSTVNGTGTLSLTDISAYKLIVPSGPWNLNQMQWWLTAYDAGAGWTPVSPWQTATGMLTAGLTYTIEAYTWPKGTNGQCSAYQNYEIISTCPKRDYVQLAWENELGGTDFYTATMNKTKVITVDKASYRAERDTQGGIGTGGYAGNTNWMGHANEDRGETIYHSDTTEQWSIMTDWLIPAEVADLEFLWKSKNVYMRTGTSSTWYPVIILNTEEVTTRDQKGLRQYEIKLRLSNKKYTT